MIGFLCFLFLSSMFFAFSKFGRKTACNDSPTDRNLVGIRSIII